MTSTPDSNTNASLALPDYDLRPLDFGEFDHRVVSVTSPEELRDIAVLIYDELSMRRHGVRSEITGFEAISYLELRYAFYRTLSQMITVCRANANAGN